MSRPQMYILRKRAQKLENIYLHVMTTFYNFALIKRKSVELKRCLGPFWKIGMFIGSSNNWSQES